MCTVYPTVPAIVVLQTTLTVTAAVPDSNCDTNSAVAVTVTADVTIIMTLTAVVTVIATVTASAIVIVTVKTAWAVIVTVKQW